MSKEHLAGMLEMLEWVIKLSYSGMPMGMFRYHLTKKWEEIAKKRKE